MINQEVIFIFMLFNCTAFITAANMTASISMGNTSTTPRPSQTTSYDLTATGNPSTSRAYTPFPSTSFNGTAAGSNTHFSPVNSSTFYAKVNDTPITPIQPMATMVISTSMDFNTQISPVNSSTFYAKPNGTLLFSTRSMTSMVITTAMDINTHISPMSFSDVPSTAVISGAVTGNVTASSTFYSEPNGTRAISTKPMTSMIKTTPQNEVLIIQASLSFTKESFDNELKNEHSLKFITMKNRVVENIETAYKKTGKLLSVAVISFKPGSIVCVAHLYFRNSTSSDLPNLKKILEDYGKNTGKFDVSAFKSYSGSNTDEDKDDDIILGLNWWQIGLILAGIVVFSLLIIIIVLCRKISRNKKKAQSKSFQFDEEPTYVLTRQLYDSVDENEEIKALGTTPIVVADEATTSVESNGDPGFGQQEISMYSFPSLTDGTKGSSENETISEVGKENPGMDVIENDYATVTDADPGSDELGEDKL